MGIIKIIAYIVIFFSSIGIMGIILSLFGLGASVEPNDLNNHIRAVLYGLCYCVFYGSLGIGFIMQNNKVKKMELLQKQDELKSLAENYKKNKV